MTRHYQRVANAMRATLHRRFPHCFRGKHARKWPLKVGIEADIAQRCPDLNLHHVRFALHDYCRSPKYLSAMIRGAARRDLDGKAAGTVDREASRLAAYKLSKLKAEYARQAAAGAQASNAGGTDGAPAKSKGAHP